MFWSLLILGIFFILLNIAGIYMLYRFLKLRLNDNLSVWLFSVSLSLGITFLLFLFGIILFLNSNFTENLLIRSSHV